MWNFKKKNCFIGNESRGILLLSTVFFILAISGSAMARLIPGFADLYSSCIYRFKQLLFALPVGGIHPFIYGRLPFSLSELLLYGIFAGLLLPFIFSLFMLIYSCLKGIPGFFRAVQSGHTHAYISEAMGTQLRVLLNRLLRLVFIVSILFFLYTYNCGINYYRESFTEQYNIAVRAYSVDELKEVCERLVLELRSHNKELYDSPAADFDFLLSASTEGGRSMSALGKEYPGLDISYPLAKPLIASRLLSVQKLTGVYSPFTVEANYNREMPRYNLPFTICHELSHLAGYMQEEEANFIAFLACRGSDNDYFRYSASLSAFVYLGNELAKADTESYIELYRRLPEGVQQELNKEREFWSQYDTRISEAADRINDGYLRANGQEAGVQSYGQVATLILWYYLDRV